MKETGMVVWRNNVEVRKLADGRFVVVDTLGDREPRESDAFSLVEDAVRAAHMKSGFVQLAFLLDADGREIHEDG